MWSDNNLVGWGAQESPIDAKGILESVVCHPTAIQRKLTHRQVNVWGATLDPRAIPLFESLLDNNERERASRMRGLILKQRYVFAHGMLRMILAPYVGVCADRLVFARHADGKPFLQDHQNIQFSLSHTGPHMLVAIGLEHELGIDLEARRDMPDQDKLVDQFFSRQEREQYWWLPPSQRQEAFFNMWTRKEALLKATGQGLQQPLDGFSVSHDLPARLLPGAYQEWSLRHLQMGRDLVGALAVSMHDVELGGGILQYSQLLS